MADGDWDSVTRIGKSRSGGGGGERQTVVKGKAALNKALLAGGVVTEKKFGTANSTSTSTQRDTKVANDPDIIPTTKLADGVPKALIDGLREKGLNHTQAAQRVNVTKSIIDNLVKGDPPQNAKERTDLLVDLEKLLGVHLTGSHIGQPKLSKGAQAKAKREAAKNTAAK